MEMVRTETAGVRRWATVFAPATEKITRKAS
jgi:hypothetical protein